MTAYIGAKIITAEPADKDGEPGYRVTYPDGYVSWSPKAVFEEAYRPVSQGEADLAGRETSAEVASIAGELLNAETIQRMDPNELVDKIQKLAGSALGQRQ